MTSTGRKILKGIWTFGAATLFCLNACASTGGVGSSLDSIVTGGGDGVTIEGNTSDDLDTKGPDPIKKSGCDGNCGACLNPCSKQPSPDDLVAPPLGV